MGLLSRAVFRETLSATLLGTLLFTFVLFLRSADKLFELLVRSSADPATIAYLFALALPAVLRPWFAPLVFAPLYRLRAKNWRSASG